MQLTAENLRAEIKKGPVGPYLFYGTEEYLKTFYIGRIKKHIIEGTEDFEEWNCHYIEKKGDDFKLGDLEEAVMSVPMMSEKIFVHYVVNLNPPKEKSEESKDKSKKAVFDDTLSLLLEIINNIDTSVVCLVIEVPSESGTPAIFNKFDKVCSMILLDSPKSNEISEWFLKRIKKEGLIAQRDVIEYFASHFSVGMFTLSGELDKLVYLAKSRGITDITMNEVKDISSLEDVSEAFGFANAIAAGDRKKALHELYLSKQRLEPVQMLFGGVMKNLSDMLYIKQLMNEGYDRADISRITKKSEYPTKRMMEAVRPLEYGSILAAVNRCKEADELRKTAYYDDTLVLERLICTLPSSKRKK